MTTASEWVVTHDGHTITSAGTRTTAESLRDLYLHCTPDAHPADVHITSR